MKQVYEHNVQCHTVILTFISVMLLLIHTKINSDTFFSDLQIQNV